MIKTKQEVEHFLSQFGVKFDIWGIFYLDRDKNEEALTADFFNEMWVFGKDMDGTELYIKIALGQPNNRTICISFHVAEHPIKYAFK